MVTNGDTGGDRLVGLTALFLPRVFRTCDSLEDDSFVGSSTDVDCF